MTTSETRLSWIEQLLLIFWDGDDIDSLIWRPCNDGVFTRVSGRDPRGPVLFAAMCSDTFVWGCADAEEIKLPDDLDSLRQALEDGRRVERESAGSDGKQTVFIDWVTLWCCRNRGMRPMKPWLDRDAANPIERALYEACGPDMESLTRP